MTESKDDHIRALEEEVQRLKLMLESAPDFITRLSVDGNFLYLNRLAAGFDMSDVLGSSVDNYVPPEFRERAWQAMARARETGTVQEYATLGRTGKDSVGHYLTRVSPVLENGEVTSMVMIATDVTALEENRTLLQVALDASGLGIWTMDPVGGGTWDETTRKIFGVTAGPARLALAGSLRLGIALDRGQEHAPARPMPFMLSMRKWPLAWRTSRTVLESPKPTPLASSNTLFCVVHDAAGFEIWRTTGICMARFAGLGVVVCARGARSWSCERSVLDARCPRRDVA